MAVETKKLRAAKPRQPRKEYRSEGSSFVRLLPGWLLIGFVLVVVLPHALAATLGATERMIDQIPRTMDVPNSGGKIAPMFSSSVEYWSERLAEWGARYNLDPNLLATIMQIESCGDDKISSYAGAQGLFQVMPFNFASGEDELDPDTNAMRGASFLNQCLGYSNGDTGLAMACYNGGPGILNRPYSMWPNQTQRYYVWGTTIYNDARQNKSSSDSLATWLNAGGVNLCQRAESALGLNS